MRPTRPGYSALLDTIRSAPYGGAARDFESRTGSLNKEKATKEKARASINKTNDQKTDG